MQYKGQGPAHKVVYTVSRNNFTDANPIFTGGAARHVTIDSIVKGLETGLINTFPADSPRCAVDNIVDSSMVASN